MITDRESNFVYISDLLEKRSPSVYTDLTDWFKKLGIKYDILPNTKDIWAVDYMPIQVKEDYFVQFTYNPDYIGKTQQKIRTNPDEVCETLGLNPEKSSIVIDGGNVVKNKRKAILTTKIFKENPGYAEDVLVDEIKKLLELDQVIVIPQEPGDSVGHSDGMVRFIDENTVLVNNYPDDKKYKDFGYSLRWSLRNAGLNCVLLPYDCWQNEKESDARGCYVNFLEVGEYIFCPNYGTLNSMEAFRIMEEVFPGRIINDIDCKELAVQGGVLNCATWNIRK
jgi:agmatine deiminase